VGGANVTIEVEAAAHRLGRLIAERGWILLNGGRNVGVMAASARGAREAGGTVIGILPGRDTHDASDDLDFAVVTGMGDARNVINVLSSDVVIACPGGAGTMSEIALALKNGKHVILLGRGPESGFERYESTGQPEVSESPEDAVERAEKLLSGES
jgi:uncharacterized protein (TIGR00725 family)